MPRRPADPELCAEFSSRLREAVLGKIRKKSAAATLGVSRQMLDLYLNGRATPGPDIILRAMKEWKLRFKHRGQEISSSHFERNLPSVKASAPQQLNLFDAINSLDQRDLQITLTKKSPDRIEMQVSIKFAG
jgi:hypothetical protein